MPQLKDVYNFIILLNAKIALFGIPEELLNVYLHDLHELGMNIIENNNGVIPLDENFVLDDGSQVLFEALVVLASWR